MKPDDPQLAHRWVSPCLSRLAFIHYRSGRFYWFLHPFRIAQSDEKTSLTGREQQALKSLKKACKVDEIRRLVSVVTERRAAID
jgi:hypothetical protein